MYDAVKLFRNNDTISDLEKFIKFKIHKPIAILTIHREYATCNKNNLLKFNKFYFIILLKISNYFSNSSKNKIALKNFNIKLDKNIKL